MQYSITVYDVADLVEVTTELVRKGFTFRARPDGERWVIELTGGY